MARTIKAEYSIVTIEWSDAWGNSSWTTIDDAKQHYASGAPCKSVGFLLNESKEGYLLAGTIGERDVNAMFFIPRAWAKVVKRGK